MMIDILKEAASKAGFSETATCPTSQVPMKEEVFGQCARNSCGRYGTNYSCPPLSGDLERCSGRVRRYPEAMVVSCVTPFRTREDTKNASAVFSAGVESFRSLIRESSLDAEVFGAGPCRVCERCAALDGEECRNPGLIRYSMEGCGIDVVGLSRALGMKYNNGEGTMTYFAMVAYTP